MASAPLLAVLATRALEASKASRAAEQPAPRPRETPAVPAPHGQPDRPRARGLGRLRRRLSAYLPTAARPRP